MTKISRFQLSALWIETNLALLEDEQPSGVPLAYLGRPYEYAPRFDDAQFYLRQQQILPVSTPWTKTKGQRFWYYYMRGVQNANVKGTDAWQRMVPFRVVLPAIIQTDSLHLPFSMMEAFLYPHAIGLAITVTLEIDGGAALDDIVTQTFRLRYDRIYKVIWQAIGDLFQGTNWPAATGTTLSLSQVADHGLGILHQVVLGTQMDRGQRVSNAPFTVLTILTGQDVPLDYPPSDNGDIQRALHALTLWQRVRPGAASLRLNKKVSLGLGELAGPADLLYGQARGRVVWYASRFTDERAQPDVALLCYHRNLMFASLQTESLYGLAREIVDRSRNRVGLSMFLPELARKTSSVLGLLYGGHQDTYRSKSPKYHIEQNGWLETVNTLRQANGMQPLHG